MMITIQIPVPIYLFKYLSAEIGNNILLSKKDNISRILLAVIKGRDKLYKKLQLKPGQVYFNVSVSERYFYRHNKCMITAESASNFLSFCETDFKRSLRTFVNGRISIKQELDLKEKRNLLSIVKAIQDFLNIYSITEEDYKFDTASKYFKRYLKQKIKDNNRNTTLPSLNTQSLKTFSAPNVQL
jgi:hypothetical protein